MDQAPPHHGFGVHPKHRGSNRHCVAWKLRRRWHAVIIYATLGVSAAIQLLVVVCAPIVKSLGFVHGSLYARRDSNFVTQSNSKADGDPLVVLRIGWLGSCITDSGISTCTLPSFPGVISDFGLVEARGAADVLAENSANAISFCAASAFTTCLAILVFRTIRLRAAYYVSMLATVLSIASFGIALNAYSPVAAKITQNTGLVGSLGLAIPLWAISCVLLPIGTIFCYSKAVNQERGWPGFDPIKPDKKPGAQAVDAGAGAMPMGDPMGVGGEMPGGEPQGGLGGPDSFGAPPAAAAPAGPPGALPPL